VMFLSYVVASDKLLTQIKGRTVENISPSDFSDSLCLQNLPLQHFYVETGF